MSDNTNYLHEELVQLIASYLWDVGVLRAVCARWSRWVTQSTYKLNIIPSDNIESIIERFRQITKPITIHFNKTNPFLALKICNNGLYSISSLRRLILDFKWEDPFVNEYDQFNPLHNILLRYPDPAYSIIQHITQLEYLSAPQVTQETVLHLTKLTTLHLTNSGTVELSVLLRSTKLCDLSLIMCKELTSAGPMHVNSTLTRLHVRQTPMSDPIWLNQLINLKDLHLYHFNIHTNHQVIFTVPMTTLESLTLAGITHEDAIASIAWNTNLTRLCLTGGFTREDYSDSCLDAWSSLTKLQVLELMHFGLFNSFPAEKCGFLTNLQSLKEFRAINGVLFVESVVQLLPDTLTHLTIGERSAIMEDDDFPDPYPQVSISRLTNLQSLNVTLLAATITDITHLTQLTSLQFWEYSPIPANDIVHLTSLKSFKTTTERKVFDWRTLSELTHLETVSVTSVDKSSNHVSLDILSKATRLHSLRIRDNSRSYGKLATLSTVTSLRLDLILHIQNDRLWTDLASLTNLRELYLLHSDAEDLKPLTALHNLTYLYSETADNVSWRSYSALTQLRVLRPSYALMRNNELINIDEWKDNLSHLVALIYH